MRVFFLFFFSVNTVAEVKAPQRQNERLFKLTCPSPNSFS